MLLMFFHFGNEVFASSGIPIDLQFPMPNRFNMLSM